ncbi:SdiA-regulated domain-containing protein [Lewinella sp. JB7]|uniref:SdiA-regulated domain-containing protein n=1 Tax=Lewinella sp. JB7 TaxID=2962887 RepID=UPI0020C98736|nr:SdiA-regulated domain-containing protein [Lewinella sp. JB7]MCP9237830.1 SdiA-regulated domain-containing protein [Lewinella sp. JB7]
MHYSITWLLMLYLLAGPLPYPLGGSRVRAQTEASLPYRLNEPELLVTLPDELEEISGLAVRGEEILAIADERGIIYRLRRADGAILERIKFWKKGDYEGIAVAGDDIWVTKSNGRLYRVRHAGTDKQQVKEYNTWLKGGNDVEGLVYDAANDRLLLACKADVRDDGRDKDNRYIFAFDPQSGKASKKAAVVIPRDDKFSPSALAIHPISGELYLTSSVGKRLTVTTVGGDIISVQRLDEELFPQPEGLAFAADGTLYLSTEAKNGAPARIYRLPLTP